MKDKLENAEEKQVNKTTNNDLRFKYAGVIGLLCKSSIYVKDDELIDSMLVAIEDWCNMTGWQCEVVKDIMSTRIEVYPPSN